MNEIERKVDMLISGMKLPKKKTRSRVVTIATSLMIAVAIIASASLITTHYYVQTGTITDVKSSITITDPLGEEHEVPWEEPVTIGIIQGTYIYPEEGCYTITNYANTAETVYISIEVTETPLVGEPISSPEGLTVEVYNSDPNPITQFIDLLGSEPFTIHITADPRIDASSTFAYTITMDWNPPN